MLQPSPKRRLKSAKRLQIYSNGLDTDETGGDAGPKAACIMRGPIAPSRGMNQKGENALQVGYLGALLL